VPGRGWLRAVAKIRHSPVRLSSAARLEGRRIHPTTMMTSRMGESFLAINDRWIDAIGQGLAIRS
jgi:hypothetical protein